MHSGFLFNNKNDDKIYPQLIPTSHKYADASYYCVIYDIRI